MEGWVPESKLLSLSQIGALPRFGNKPTVSSRGHPCLFHAVSSAAQKRHQSLTPEGWQPQCLFKRAT